MPCLQHWIAEFLGVDPSAFKKKAAGPPSPAPAAAPLSPAALGLRQEEQVNEYGLRVLPQKVEAKAAKGNNSEAMRNAAKDKDTFMAANRDILLALVEGSSLKLSCEPARVQYVTGGGHKAAVAQCRVVKAFKPPPGTERAT